VLSSDVDQYKVIDTDTHVIEPYDLWTSRLPSSYGDRVPHVQWDEEYKEDSWYFGDKRVGAAASAAQAGWHEYPPDHPPSLDKVNPATWDAHKRLALMENYGIYAAVLYPNVAGFGAGKLLTMDDPGLMLGCVRAYNDFLTEYSSADPKRYIPIAALPMWDLDLTIAEVERAAAAGHKGVIMTGEPRFWGTGTACGRSARRPSCRSTSTSAPATCPSSTAQHPAAGPTPTTPASACSSACPTCG